jgi:cobaltochelatase CobN
MNRQTSAWTLVYFSVTSNEIPNLSRAVARYGDEIGPIRVTARTRTQLEGNLERQNRFIEEALAADVLVVTLMAGSQSFPGWESLINAVQQARDRGRRAPYVHIQPTGSSPAVLALVEAHADSFAQGHWQTLNHYHRFGDADNLLQLLISLHNHCFATDLECRPPAPLPFDGIYHPDLDHIPEPATYRQGFDPGRPTIGIWFYQNFWATGNCAHIDAMIREIEHQGANALCVFHMRFKDRLLGNSGPGEIVGHYFMDNGKPVIDVLLSPVMFSLRSNDDDNHPLKRLGVPVLQAMTTGQELARWRDSPQGLTNVDITIGVAQPELDGVIIGVPVAAKQTTAIDPLTGSAINTYLPIAERIAAITRMALNWARLRRLANHDKKIAIVFHHYPPRNDRIGCASGLDSFESVKVLIDQLIARGYRIDHPYDNGNQLAEALRGRLTADRRWLLPEQMAQRCEASIDCVTARAWHQDLPKSARTRQAGDWGPFPGDIFVHDNRLLFPGLTNGHLLLTIQPPRGSLEAIDQLYHNQNLTPPYPYTAQYRWIKEIFGADAVLHIGKHGSLEWLPGKAVGLDETCWPDMALMELPNIYPYIINDPGEGTQAKRRANACIVDHLPPALTNAELDEELAALDRLLAEYREALVQDQGKLGVLRSLIWEATTGAELDRDLGLEEPQSPEALQAMVERLHDYLGEIADTTITDGLHILGQVPQGPLLSQTLAQLTRLENSNIPSLRDAVIEAMGHDPHQVRANRGKPLEPETGLTGAEVTARAHQICLALLTDLIAEPDRISAIVERHLPRASTEIERILLAVRDDLLPRLRRTSDELDACLDALEGRFVPPGPSGAPSRGQAGILPTGRNFYSVDPHQIPTPAAWRVGQRLADALLERYLREEGRYPASIGIVLWASPTMRSKGDDVAQILALMGLRPIWQPGSGSVRGLEVIPPEELGRPRIDVVPRISGIFRDAFPTLIDLIDQGVTMVAALDEQPEDNFLRSHVLRDESHWRDLGLDPEQARRRATFRIFSAPPGSYGTGVSELVESKAWRTSNELGEMYIRWSSHAYGRGVFGEEAVEGFRRVLGRMEVTIKNEDSREKDMMTCTDFYSHHGGLISAVRSVRGQSPVSLAGDNGDPERIVMRTTTEEARHIFRARLLNPKWLQGLQRHGYKGAGDLSKAMDIILGWDATAGVVDDWMYRRFAEKVPLDPGIRAWMRQVNPHALHNIVDKLLEAAARSLWQADQTTLDKLREVYLDVEGEIEEISE